MTALSDFSEKLFAFFSYMPVFKKDPSTFLWGRQRIVWSAFSENLFVFFSYILNFKKDPSTYFWGAKIGELCECFLKNTILGNLKMRFQEKNKKT